jgi:hypothetical protein
MVTGEGADRDFGTGRGQAGVLGGIGGRAEMSFGWHYLWQMAFQ